MKSDNIRNSLIEDNIGLVHSCANRFRGRGVEYDDLFQAGCIGLIKAADGFNAQLGFAFSTYAVPAILGEIRRIFRDGGSVKVGRAMKEKARALLREKERLENELGTEPTISELAERADISVEEAAQLITSALPPLSLTSSCEDGETREFDLPTDAPEEKISDSVALGEVMSTLGERDRSIIEMRYYRGLTQTVTARMLGMSQVQVSRRERAILLEMRKKLTG
ncbi:MAG: sigma-70 family RNA polymerase sigma factor [Clostridiales bacterium]|nr:sigma-70 family RNA polymerase sigma factor [Clostridiales bacterium]